ncbi:hypothetical protein [Pedobacter frigoris]|uniref:hypothetical protein n=1 Tax=Pedobacter frigoris TaxID=2571272 RepID=UPI00292F6E7B|nr:hypothetical protein [Pedobacter frigoris]
MRIPLTLIFLIIIALTGCRKSDDITTDKDAKLVFSSDTVLFDTVFTTVGSTNKRIKVYNIHHKDINISNIRLSGGNHSPFSLIINGQPVNQRDNIEIGSKDSINIFIKVSINPNNQSQPFIVQDSILFNTNGNEQTVQLIAYGQNAVFINGQVISNNTTWTSTLPYIIYKSVTVAPDVTLNIPAGTKVLFHNGAAMLVRGSLNAQGKVTQPILFAGDRMENSYAEEPGQWMGIHFYSSSINSKIINSTIKNAIIGITADSLSKNGGPKLLLSGSVVKNMSITAIAGYGTSVTAFTNLFFNCGQYILYGISGGNYNIKQNTFGGYNPLVARKTPAVYLSDLGKNSLSGNLKAVFINNIIWGSLTEEFLIDKKTTNTIDTDIRNNIIRTSLQTYSGNDNQLDTDPGFVNSGKFEFGLLNNSAALKKGADLTADPYFNLYLNKDLNGLLRNQPPTLGCYEK